MKGIGFLKILSFVLVLLPHPVFTKGRLRIRIVGPNGKFWGGERVHLEFGESLFGSLKEFDLDTDSRGEIEFVDYKKIFSALFFKLSFLDRSRPKKFPEVSISVLSQNNGGVFLGRQVVSDLKSHCGYPVIISLRKGSVLWSGSFLKTGIGPDSGKPIGGGNVWALEAGDPRVPSVGKEFNSFRYVGKWEPKEKRYKIFGSPGGGVWVLGFVPGFMGGMITKTRAFSLSFLGLAEDFGKRGRRKFEKMFSGPNGLVFFGRKEIKGCRFSIVKRRGKRYVLWRAWNFFGNSHGVFVDFRIGIGLSRLRFNLPVYTIDYPCYVKRLFRTGELNVGSGPPVFSKGQQGSCYRVSCGNVEGDIFVKEKDENKLVLLWRSTSTFIIDDYRGGEFRFHDVIGPWKWVCAKK